MKITYCTMFMKLDACAASYRIFRSCDGDVDSFVSSGPYRRNRIRDRMKYGGNEFETITLKGNSGILISSYPTELTRTQYYMSLFKWSPISSSPAALV